MQKPHITVTFILAEGIAGHSVARLKTTPQTFQTGH
jgi:hypothetical protein